MNPNVRNFKCKPVGHTWKQINTTIKMLQANYFLEDAKETSYSMVWISVWTSLYVKNNSLMLSTNWFLLFFLDMKQ